MPPATIMSRSSKYSLFGSIIFAAALLAQEQDGIQRGRIKKVVVDQGVITITRDGKDRDLWVTEQTRIVGATNEESRRGIKEAGLKIGSTVLFKAVEKNGKMVLLGLKIGGNDSPGDEPASGIRQGKIKKIDLDKMLLTLTVGPKDHVFRLREDTRVLGSRGKDLKARLEGFKEGSAVFFKADKRDGFDEIVALKLAANSRPAQRPGVDTSNFKSLPRLAKEEYRGFQGGLYAEGKNERPATHERIGLAFARQVQPRDAGGKPDPAGKIVLLSVGMSNTSQVFSTFKRIADADPDKSSMLIVVDGAQGGMTASRIRDANDNGSGARYWSTVDQRLEANGVSRAQVQVAWIKQADAGPSQGFPGYARTLQGELRQIVQLMHGRFTNLKLVYLSSRTYAGYASTRLNPEPYAYESGFSVKWLIEEQLKGDAELNFDPKRGAVRAPWLSWGPYLWANGRVKNADGLSYEESDFGRDGTHPSAQGQRKVALALLNFFKTDSTCRPWFVVAGATERR